MLKVKKMSNPTKIIKLVEHSHKTEPYVGLVNENLEDLRELYIDDILVATHILKDDVRYLNRMIGSITAKGQFERLEDLFPGCLEDDDFMEAITAPVDSDLDPTVGWWFPRMKPVDGVDYETVEREIA